MCPLPQPLPEPPPIIAPEDVDYPGAIRLEVDCVDVQRGIFHGREIIPVEGPGRLTLLYPKWLPGHHAPAAPIELFAGLVITANGATLNWKRDPVEVYAFHVDVPPGASEIEARFQCLTPTSDSQGEMIVAPGMLLLRWNTVLLYPAGYYARRILVQASVTLPDEWAFACALEQESAEGSTALFAPTPLDQLVDSPLMAGRYARRVVLDDERGAALNLFADRPDQLEATEEQIAPHRRLLDEAEKLFASRHYDRYEFLFALSDVLGSVGVEHQQSCEIVTSSDYFTGWDKADTLRDTIAHEYVHSWNGKFRRGADSWIPSFDRPIRNSLMWVYEGQTQYWGEVLAARSGLWTPERARQSLASTAATYAHRAGGRWRPMSDTTRDPIIASRQPLPWRSWQRSEDYYSEGQLMWLDVDTLIRELSDDTRSLDDFARAFFGVDDGETTTCTYEFKDVIETLDAIAPYDWEGFLVSWLDSREEGTRLGGLERGGYRLIYKETPSAFEAETSRRAGVVNLRFSLGLAVSNGGVVQEVLWDSPAFAAGLTAGAKVLAVNGRSFGADELKHAVTDARAKGRVELLVERAGETRTLTVEYDRGHRHPHLEAIAGARLRLDEIHDPGRSRKPSPATATCSGSRLEGALAS